MGIVIDNVRLPEHLEQGAKMGPSFSTSLVTLASGIEQANQNWQDELLEVDASYGIMDKVSGYDPEDSYYAISSFFRARRGRARGFLFKDASDFEAVEELIFQSPTVPLRYQLCKVYGNYQRRITRIDEDTLQLFKDGLVIPENQYMVYPKGLIRFLDDEFDPSGVTATFEFFIPMRFVNDKLQVTLTHIRAGQVPDILLIQVRE